MQFKNGPRLHFATRRCGHLASVGLAGFHRLRVKPVVDQRDSGELNEFLTKLRKRLKVAIQMGSRR